MSFNRDLLNQENDVVEYRFCSETDKIDILEQQLAIKDKQIEILRGAVEDATEYIGHYGGQWKHDEMLKALEEYNSVRNISESKG